MGISGLLPLLRSIHKPCNLEKFRGQTIGVDAYGWLHRGTVACAIDLALGKPTTKFVDFSMHRVNMLKHYGVIPYLVFDGDYLPSKAATEKDRAKRREESKKVGLELHRLGKVSQAHLELQKAIDVTPEMARQLIDELKKIDVQYVVAPYEADAQLAYLEKQGAIQGILSEDSDLLVFGAKCLLTKLDQYGNCVEISRSDFTSCREISLVGWTDADFRCMAILSGCDYLANINKMGLKTAYRLVRKYKTIEKILRMLQFDGQYHVPDGYLEAFRRAESTFLHQRVFCPTANAIVMATQLPSGCNAADMAFLGKDIDADITVGLIQGDLHPMTKKPIVVRGKVSCSPQTPWTGTRRQTVPTSSGLKPNKSIDTFFKAKRTPLAELDPNTFTPSPSQQRLLHRTNGPWASSPAPQRPSLARSPASLSSVDSRTTSVRGAVAASVSVSAPHPPKKRRLCSDPATDESSIQGKSLTGERSRFFTSSTSISSVRTQRTKKKEKCSRASFEIWSDDSIEDAMADLPDMSQTAETSTCDRTLGSDASQGEMQQQGTCPDLSSSSRQTESQSSTSSQSTLASEICMSTSVTSIPKPTESQSLAKKLDAQVQSELAMLRKQYLYQPEPERCRAQRQEIANATRTRDNPPSNGKRALTPLQRLGATALNRANSRGLSLDRRTQASQEQHVRRPSASPQPLQATNALESPALPPTKANVEPIDIKGSEDAMVPESEPEESEAISSDDGRGRPKLDLGRYKFSG
ncbi:MAG: hypothetical protein Q9183_000831 [Haloplaca sp. 2 TL-2023]